MVVDPFLLLPVATLATWSMVMLVWMLVLRVSTIVSTRMVLDPHAPRGEQMQTLPSRVRWKGDNYNHLMEQPTVFYAIMGVHLLSGHATALTVGLAWAYVALRIVHSLQQALHNRIEVRFGLFLISSGVLIALCVQAMAGLIGGLT